MQGFIRPVARVGSGDPVRVLRLYTMNTLDEVIIIIYLHIVIYKSHVFFIYNNCDALFTYIL